MMLVIITSLVLFGNVAFGLHNGCPSADWKVFEARCYYFSTEETDWFTASYRCSLSNAFLAHILKETVNEFIRVRLNPYNYGKDYHIGATDASQEGLFMWDQSYRELNDAFTNWSPGEPNEAGSEDCSEMHIGTGKWNGISCRKVQRYVCWIPVEA